ncbi:MAG: hypothetical protein GEV04_22135 [Actinophytocola sp.]|nr:hypothetical protein [Actinophytocola sp.]
MTATGTRQHLVWVTTAGRARDHAVIAKTLAERSRASAELVAQCGEVFWPAPLIADPGESCPRCVGYLRSCREGGRVCDRRREGVIGRWLTAVVGGTRRLKDVAVSSDDRAAHSLSREIRP